MNTLKSSWTDVVALPDEHRIFKATDACMQTSLPRMLRGWPGVDEFGGWAVADQSGEWPEHTNDGILWLNFSTNIMLGPRYSNTIHIPLLDPEGKSSTFVTDPASLLILSEMFRWTMNTNGMLYRAVRW